MTAAATPALTCSPLLSVLTSYPCSRLTVAYLFAVGASLINTIVVSPILTSRQADRQTIWRFHTTLGFRPDAQRQPEQRWTFQSRSQRRSRLRLEPRPQPLQSRAAAGQAPSSRSRQRSTPVRDPHGQQRVASGVALPLPSWPFPTLCTRVHVGRQRHGSRTFADRPGRARTLPKQLEGGGGS